MPGRLKFLGSNTVPLRLFLFGWFQQRQIRTVWKTRWNFFDYIFALSALIKHTSQLSRCRQLSNFVQNIYQQILRYLIYDKSCFLEIHFQRSRKWNNIVTGQSFEITSVLPSMSVNVRWIRPARTMKRPLLSHGAPPAPSSSSSVAGGAQTMSPFS